MEHRIVVVVLAVLLVIEGAEAQAPPGNRAQVISNIFQIPIQTLTAISNLAQNTRPLGEILQRRRSPQTERTGEAPLPSPNGYRSRAARISGLYTASDGSGFRI